MQACLKQKGTHVHMRTSTYEALTKSTGTAIDSRPTQDGTREIARTELYKALELLDAQAITYRLAPKNTPEIAGDRSSSTHFWQRMRELKTTQCTYNGPIYRTNGQRCNTVQDLDQAMIDTRSFWEESPPETQSSWHPLLVEFQAGNSFFPPFPDLRYSLISSTQESAPGLDGIPYAAWRLNPEESSHAIYKLFTKITRAQGEPPSQVLVWIPKAVAGPTKDYFPPLGMPNTSYRVLPGALSALVVAHCSQYLHPSQSNHKRLFSLSSRTLMTLDPRRLALFIDMAKAYPRWVVDVMFCLALSICYVPFHWTACPPQSGGSTLTTTNYPARSRHGASVLCLHVLSCNGPGLLALKQNP